MFTEEAGSKNLGKREQEGLVGAVNINFSSEE